MRQLEDVGAVICAAGAGLAPADKKLYALRDVTGTVEAIPLIASSIMSKKIAEGTGALVLDVKVGSGAFMKNVDDARELARTMVDLGTDAGVTDRRAAHQHAGAARAHRRQRARGARVGRGAGRRRARGRGRADPRPGPRDARRRGTRRRRPRGCARDGRAMDAWKADDPRPGRRPRRALPRRKESHEVLAPADGVLTELDALKVGVAAWRLGAGRARKEDPVQAGAGVEMHAKPGAAVRAGEKLLTLHTDTPERFERALESLDGAFTIAPEGSRPDLLPLVIEKIS